MALDLDRYFARIGLDGPRTANVDTLERLCFAHARTISFENLDIHRGPNGIPISIALPNVFEKLVLQKRGGYCFEQNTLLLEVLRALGYHARPLAARVLMGLTPTPRPRTHMLVLVESGGHAFLADVGFGGHNLLGPIVFEPDRERVAHGETFRIREIPWDGKAHAPPPAFDLELKKGDGWVPLYRTSIEHQDAEDFVMSHWYTSTHPDSLFVHKKLISRADAGMRQVLFDRELTIKRTGAATETRVLESDEAYRAVLSDVFGLELPADPPLRW